MEKIAFVDYRIRKKELKELENLNIKVVLIPKSKNVYEEISSHTDIFMCKIGKYLIVSEEIYEYILNEVNKIDENLSEFIIKGESKLFEEYPKDIPFNVCNIGKKVVHNFRYTDEKILEIVDKLNLEKIDIKQGYSNCSIAIIDENSVITTDRSIEKELIRNKIDVLFIEKDNNIKLLNKDKYSNMSGFIGGTISRVKNNIVITGDILNFKEYEKIKSFIESRNLKIIDFKDYDLIDYGGIITI